MSTIRLFTRDYRFKCPDFNVFCGSHAMQFLVIRRQI
jgi:hypothetical protein